jgi:uncharacterized small protein (TIGR04563 family)
MPNDRRKKSIYLHGEVADEIRAEASRLRKSISWIMQKAWKLARERIKAEAPCEDIAE